MAKTAFDTAQPKTRNRVTISDVSAALGLTKSTVSRAMNDYPDIAESTRQRVRHMANKMGYHPLSFAQAIRTGLTKSLGLVIQMADHDAQRPFLAEFLAGLSQGGSAQGFTLTLATTRSQAQTLDTFRSMIRDRKVDGFVLPRTLVDDPRVHILRDADMPFVLFGRTADPTGCAWYDVRGEDAMRDGVRHLVRLGHRRIGFINGPARYSYAALRRDGYLAAMSEAGLAAEPILMAEDAVTIPQGRAAAHRLLAQPHPPTAILCAVDMAALGVYRAAADLGLRIGSDLSTLAYDGVPDGAHVTPPLSTYAVDVTAAGLALSTMLIERIRGAAPETLRVTTTATFLDRGSVNPPRLGSGALADLIATNTKDLDHSNGGKP